MLYTRLVGADKNRFAQSCASLMGIAVGLMADRVLNDAEISFLHRWLLDNEDVALAWPGDVLHARVKAVLADGVITADEREHLVDTLEKICGGSLEQVGKPGAVNQLAFDEQVQIQFPGASFCVTGDFIYGPRERVEQSIVERGGEVQKGITKKLKYLVVGLRGSDEWKHGSYGTKIEKAIAYKRDGLQLFIVPEDRWTAALRSN